MRGDEIVGAFALEDEIRPEARQAVADLQAMGVNVTMITGDARQVADTVGAELGIDDLFAEVLPEDKDLAVVELQNRGLSVALVGDGVNVAPALARADVGIAIPPPPSAPWWAALPRTRPVVKKSLQRSIGSVSSICRGPTPRAKLARRRSD